MPDRPGPQSATASEAGFRAVAIALGANVGVAAAKLVGFVLTGSGAMLAEFAHSLADTGNQGVLLAGRRRAARNPDQEHPFGYGAVRFLGAFLVAEVLFVLGAAFSIGEGVLKLVHPHALDNLVLDIVILGVAVVFEAASLRAAVKASRETRHGAGWLSFIRSTRVPELAVLLVEDTGALAGLGFALAAVTLSALTGSTTFDAAGSLAVGAVLGVNSILLGLEMSSLLVGETASTEELATIERALVDTPGIDRLVHLRAVHVGPEELLVAAKVVFAADLSAEAAAVVVDDAEVVIRATVPTASWVYIEPGRREPGPSARG
ncbi:MAG TPA: cation diffusion facilitator family transporter [Acidimicrobiales bacterium]|nr:cation diffusion facilitator family transporter [Acidimicrobiales bacterium]